MKKTKAKANKSVKSVTLKESELRKIKKQCTDEAIQVALGMVYLTLHSYFKFDEKKLEQFRLEIERAAEHLNNGMVSAKDLQLYMKNELKFDSLIWQVK